MKTSAVKRRKFQSVPVSTRRFTWLHMELTQPGYVFINCVAPSICEDES